MGEFNVMIAEKEYRRKGYGYYTVLLVLMWAIRYLKLKEFFVKIKETNTASIKMFEKIGFKFVNYSKYFKENEPTVITCTVGAKPSLAQYYTLSVQENYRMFSMFTEEKK